MKNSALVIFLASLTFGFPSFVSAHGGGLDKYGCHTNRKTGEYHCHRSGAVPPPINQAIPKQGSPYSAPQPSQTDDTCYTGPRGGRYRIINGKKRYGC